MREGEDEQHNLATNGVKQCLSVPVRVRIRVRVRVRVIEKETEE